MLVPWLLLIALAAAGAPDGLPTAEPPPMVVDAARDVTDGLLIIVGEHFGTAMPLVMLDGVPLLVTSWAPTEIGAELPRGYATANHYHVEVYRGPLMEAHGVLAIDETSLADRLRAPK
jgi:hypothetical protein